MTLQLEPPKNGANQEYPALACPLCGSERKPWSLNKNGSVTYAPVEHRPDTTHPASAAAARRKAKALASQHGVTIEREGDLLWVFHKGLHAADDPCCGMHTSYDWPEALEKVQAPMPRC